jgi:hypothetical protein
VLLPLPVCPQVLYHRSPRGRWPTRILSSSWSPAVWLLFS